MTYSAYEADMKRGKKLVALQEKAINGMISYEDCFETMREIYVEAIDFAVQNGREDEFKLLNNEYKEKFISFHYRYFKERIGNAKFEPIPEPSTMGE